MMNLAEYRRKGTRFGGLPALGGAGRPRVVQNKDGTLQRSARFRGPGSRTGAVAAELVAVAGRINNAFRRLGSGWAIFVEAQRVAAADYPDSRFPDPASALLDAERPCGLRRAGGRNFQSRLSLVDFPLLPAARRKEAARGRDPGFYEGPRQEPASMRAEVLRGFH